MSPIVAMFRRMPYCVERYLATAPLLLRVGDIEVVGLGTRSGDVIAELVVRGRGGRWHRVVVVADTDDLRDAVGEAVEARPRLGVEPDRRCLPGDMGAVRVAGRTSRRPGKPTTSSPNEPITR